MSRLIDADALYEKACDLEAQALDYAVKISNDEEKREEWLRWSAILAERTAFKHDVYDAPTIEPERLTEQPEIIRCKDCKHHHRDNSGAYYCGRKDYGYGWGLNDFCSRAERRTDGSN